MRQQCCCHFFLCESKTVFLMLLTYTHETLRFDWPLQNLGIWWFEVSKTAYGSWSLESFYRISFDFIFFLTSAVNCFGEMWALRCCEPLQSAENVFYIYGHPCSNSISFQSTGKSCSEDLYIVKLAVYPFISLCQDFNSEGLKAMEMPC